MGKETRESRRQFLHQMGTLLAGATGLLKLASAMSEEVGTFALPRCPGMPSVTCQGFTCDQAQLQYHCTNDFTCSPFICEPSWSGDFNCQLSPDGNTFTCIDLFHCVGSEPGAQFTCEDGVTFDCRSAPQPFYCDHGDFNCAGIYNCNGNPGGGYTMPRLRPPVIVGP